MGPLFTPKLSCECTTAMAGDKISTLFILGKLTDYVTV